MANLLSMQDISTNGSNRAISKDFLVDKYLPYILLPALLLIATYSFTATIIVMAVIGISALYVYSRPQQKNRSPFFFSWTLSSCFFMFLSYVLIILSYLEITQLENLVFIIFLGSSCYFFYKTRKVAQLELSGKGKEYSPVITSESKYCHICQLEVNERYFHTIWWGCCIYRPNYMFYLFGQIFAFCSLLLGTNFGLTTICRPFVLIGPILLPDDCSSAYDDIMSSFGFVTCVYALGYLLVIAFILIRQTFLVIPKYTACGSPLLNIGHPQGSPLKYE